MPDPTPASLPLPDGLQGMSPFLVAGALALAALLGAWLGARLGALRRRRRAHRRARRWVAGEARAARLLRRAGYRVEATQARTQLRLEVDGEPLEVELRVDFLVSKGGRRFVADAKTGREAPALRNAATRRQLLEYRCAFAVDGALLVDAESGRVRRIEFELPG
ncbi:MAG: PD-(D/E)XK nuclease family protein [Myxococcota bacterium]